jgi:hypothetical protein
MKLYQRVLSLIGYIGLSTWVPILSAQDIFPPEPSTISPLLFNTDTSVASSGQIRFSTQSRWCLLMHESRINEKEKEISTQQDWLNELGLMGVISEQVFQKFFTEINYLEGDFPFDEALKQVALQNCEYWAYIRFSDDFEANLWIFKSQDHALIRNFQIIYSPPLIQIFKQTKEQRFKIKLKQILNTLVARLD